MSWLPSIMLQIYSLWTSGSIEIQPKTFDARYLYNSQILSTNGDLVCFKKSLQVF